MIKDLILSPDFSAWTWEQSNGTATDEQTVASYNVLVASGQCSDFSRHVWNDIVDTLSDALAAVNVEWDSTYCTAEECKINEPLGALMAYAWNSVAWNIKRFGFVRWKWAHAYYMPGYVGKDAFNGYSTHGESADNLFAWYILELTEKLNKLIEVFKNEADLAGFVSSEHTATNTKVRMSAPKVLSVKAGSVVDSFTEAPLVTAPALPMIVTATGKSYAKTRLVPVPVLPACGVGSGYSYQNGILLPLGISRLYVWSNAETSADAQLKSLGINRLRTDAIAETRPLAQPKALGVGAMKTDAKVQSLQEAYAASLVAKSAKSFMHTKTNTEASAVSEEIAKLSHEGKSEFSVDAALKPLPLTWLGATQKAVSKEDALMRADNPTYLEAPDWSESNEDARINALPAVPFIVMKKAESHDSGVITTKQSNPLSGFGKGSSVVLAKPETRETSRFRNAIQAVSNVVASLEFWQKVFEWVDPIQTGSNLYIQCVYSSWREDEKGYIDVAVWYDPKRVGSDLYLRSAYQAYADGSKEFVDMAVYYEPVRTDNDLYIKGAQLAYSDGTEGFVDMAVYYEPQQTGSNLYLRSAESMKGVIDDG